MTRVLIALTSHPDLGDTGRSTGFYASEAAEPWSVFRDAGFEVDLVSVAGGVPPVDGRDEGDAVQQRFFAEANLVTPTADGRLVTGQNPPSAEAAATAVANLLA